MRQIAWVAALAVAVVTAPPVLAQDYPNRPIKIIQGFAPGGNADAVARVLANEMTKGLGQPIVVEAKPGAGGTIGADAVAKSPPDGYTLYLVTGGHVVAGALYKTLPYKTVDDFDWISTASTISFVVSVKGDSKTPTLKAVLDDARARPGAVSFGSPGIGATQHLASELLGSTAGVKLLHVPYRGESAALTALLGGEVGFIITAATAVTSQVQAGTLKAIAVTGTARWSGLPDVPTAIEGGLPGYEVTSWTGLITAAGTPRPIVQKLNAEIQRTLQVAEVRSRLEGFGGVVTGSTSEEMRARANRELVRWNKVIDDAKIERQ
jgi:tripartite-type tricarboxylate transporter receptor subunit TctC